MRYKTKRIIDLLEAARDAATLERASFGRIFPDNPIYPTNEEEVTPFIRERVQLHHETWIIDPINEVLRILKG